MQTYLCVWIQTYRMMMLSLECYGLRTTWASFYLFNLSWLLKALQISPFPPTDPQRPAPLSPGLTRTTVCVQGFEYLHVSYLVKFFLPSPFPLRSLCLFRASNTSIIYKNRYIYPNQFSSLVYYSSLSEFARIFWTSALLVEFKMSQVLLFTDNASVGIRAFVFCTYVDISVIHCCMTTYHRS